MNQIFGVGNNQELRKIMLDFALNSGSVIIEKEEITVTGRKNLMIFDKHILRTGKNAGIIAFLSSKANYNSLVIPKGFIGICEGNNKNALKCLMDQNTHTITFGMSKTDTVTISSITENEAQISLQRAITNLSGEIIEPFEFIIKRNTSSPTACLLKGTLNILCNEF